MEGLFFYLIAWGCWIYTTFIMKKGQERTITAFLILTVIIFAHYHLSFFDLSITAAFIVCLMFSYYNVAMHEFRTQSYLFIVCLMVTLIYVGFFLFQLYDPVIIMFHSSWMTACFILIIILLSIRDPFLRIIAAIIGVSQGDVIVWLFLKDLAVEKMIGGFVVLDVLAITVFLIFMWNTLEWVIMSLQNKIKPLNESEDANVQG